VIAAVLVLLGVAMVLFGVTFVFWPAGLVLVGVLVCAAGLFGVESGE
jgi:hypothetical protein